MATIEVIFSPSLTQPEPTRLSHLPCASPVFVPSNFQDSRGAR